MCQELSGQNWFKGHYDPIHKTNFAANKKLRSIKMFFGEKSTSTKDTSKMRAAMPLLNSLIPTINSGSKVECNAEVANAKNNTFHIPVFQTIDDETHHGIVSIQLSPIANRLISDKNNPSLNSIECVEILSAIERGDKVKLHLVYSSMGSGSLSYSAGIEIGTHKFLTFNARITLSAIENWNDSIAERKAKTIEVSNRQIARDTLAASL